MPQKSTLQGLDSIGDLLKQLGGVSPGRIRLRPPPGKATEKDVFAIHRREKRLYELVDGVLVEKVMGIVESYLACDMIKILGMFLDQHPHGFLLGPDGAVRLMPGLIRIPDISFLSWKQLPNRETPRGGRRATWPRIWRSRCSARGIRRGR
jgi:hypothetical protein